MINDDKNKIENVEEKTSANTEVILDNSIVKEENDDSSFISDASDNSLDSDNEEIEQINYLDKNILDLKTYTFEEIVGIIRQRQDIQSPLLSKMIEIKERYNGEYVIPLPSMDEEPVLPPLTPALISENIDAIAQRAASVTPYIGCPAIDPSKERGRRSRQYADIRKRALAATWYQNKYKLKMRRAYRHLAGYATTALVVNPDFENGMPKIEVRDPLGVYPEPQAAENYDVPRNCAFVYGKSGDWLRANYPAA